MNNKVSRNYNALFADIKILIEQSKQQVAVVVNSTMTMLYWQIGKRIVYELQDKDRSEIYGKEVVSKLCKDLSDEYGNIFAEKSIRRMMQFFNIFPEEKIVVSLIRKLSWTHILAVIPIEDPLKREFYIEMCYLEKWSVRTFRSRINSMLYERTAISKKPEETIKYDLELLKCEQKLTPDLVFRDPYFLDFLGLRDKYSEKDLETAIIVELQNFVIEFGSDFAFMDRQKRISVDNEDYYLDLLFYHRRLKCLIAIELKLGKFEAGHKGQMELYLQWLDKNMKVDGENSPIGLILCAGKSKEHIEFLQLENSNIKVADYLTQFPDIKLLEQKLRTAIEIAKQRLEANNDK
ncbi:MAG: PDDEXK nuclease domain-containing protein [Bacteroidetes bacterium]|nr:PDDEXK nuclease domain-containing protein [Bacteroidota bacterium]MCL2303654.1 PDDEXK nuclease domain-containing protein [Lentimicrobiaceae bacterium]